MRVDIIRLIVLTGLLLAPVQQVGAAPRADVKNDQVTFAFPESATFSAILESTSEITSVVLEYGTEQQTCGEVIAKAFPQFTPSESVDAEWVWEIGRASC